MLNSFRLLLLLILFLLSNITAQTVDEYELHQLKALKGLDKFGVYVWDIEGYHEDSTLVAADIEKFVHKALSSSKIKSVEFSDARGIEGAPNLEVSIQVYQKSNKNSYVYSITLRFIQDALLIRNNAPHYSVIVWERDDLGHASLRNLNLEIKVALNSLIDQFIGDYYKVNNR